MEELIAFKENSNLTFLVAINLLTDLLILLIMESYNRTDDFMSLESRGLHSQAAAQKVLLLEKKIQIILSHNLQLLKENQTLNQLIHQTSKNNSKYQMEADQLRFKIAKEIEFEHKRTIDQLQNKNTEYIIEIDRLMADLSRMNQDYQDMESRKNTQIKFLKDKLQFQVQKNPEGRKQKKESVQLYQQQIRSLKESVDYKNYEIEVMAHAHRLDLQKLHQEINYINNSMKHQENMKELEFKEIVSKYEAEMTIRQNEQKALSQKDQASWDREQAKFRKDITEKEIEINKLKLKMTSTCQDASDQVRKTINERERLKQQREDLIQFGKEQMEAEKKRLEINCKQEVRRAHKTHQIKQEALQSQLLKQKQRIELKQKQIQRLEQQIQLNKSIHSKETDSLKIHLRELQNKLHQVISKNKLENQLLNLRFAQLSDADIRVMYEQLQNQVQKLAKQLFQKDKLITSKSQRVHNQIRDKINLRNSYEIQLAQLRNKHDELRLIVDNIKLQMKEQVASITSKMEMKSMGLIQESQNQARAIILLEQEKNKLQQLIINKDKEISQCEEKHESTKDNYVKQIRVLNQQLKEKEAIMNELNIIRIQDLNNHQKEIQQIKYQQQQDLILKDNQVKHVQSIIQELKKNNQEKDKQIVMNQYQIINLKKQIQSVNKNLQQKMGVLQSITLQFNAHSQTQLQKHKIIYTKAERSLKQYYSEKIQLMKKQIIQLKDLLKEKQQHLLREIEKNNQLKQKIGTMVENSQKLKIIEQKISGLGLDKSLISNLRTMFKNRFD